MDFQVPSGIAEQTLLEFEGLFTDGEMGLENEELAQLLNQTSQPQESNNTVCNKPIKDSITSNIDTSYLCHLVDEKGAKYPCQIKNVSRDDIATEFVAVPNANAHVFCISSMDFDMCPTSVQCFEQTLVRAEGGEDTITTLIGEPLAANQKYFLDLTDYSETNFPYQVPSDSVLLDLLKSPRTVNITDSQSSEEKEKNDMVESPPSKNLACSEDSTKQKDLETTTATAKRLPTLPIQTLEQLKDYEKFLAKSGENRKWMVNILAVDKFDTAKKAICHILSHLMTGPVRSTFTFHTHKIAHDKQAFRTKFPNLWECVLKASRKAKIEEDTSDSALEKHAMDLFTAPACTASPRLDSTTVLPADNEPSFLSYSEHAALVKLLPAKTIKDLHTILELVKSSQENFSLLVEKISKPNGFETREEAARYILNESLMTCHVRSLLCMTEKRKKDGLPVKLGFQRTFTDVYLAYEAAVRRSIKSVDTSANAIRCTTQNVLKAAITRREKQIASTADIAT